MMSALTVTAAPVARMHCPPSAGFAPAAVEPPEHFLRGLAALRAGLRNPLELWDRALFSLPQREIRRFGRLMLEVVDPALMHQVLVRERDKFRRSEFQLRFTRPLVGTGLLTADGEDWRVQRHAAAPCFRARALELLAPAISQAGRNAVTALRQGGGAADVMPVMMKATFDVVIQLLSDRVAHVFDQQRFDRAASDYLEGLGLPVLFDMCGLGGLYRLWPTKYSRAIKEMRDQVGDATRLRAQAAPSDLLGRLDDGLQARAQSSDGERDLIDSVVAFITAGNETAALALTWALYLVANDKTVQRRLAEESRRVLSDGNLTSERIDQLEFHLQVVKEALRLYPPIALMQRTALRPVRIGKTDLLKGDEVVCATYVTHRSELFWERPELFDPDRFDAERSADRPRFAFIPFGAGRHACIGMPLAYMELTGILAMLTRALSFAPDPRHVVRPVMQLTLRPEGGMPLRITPIEPPARTNNFAGLTETN